MWQYITLMKRIYLIDCPGVVPPSIGDTPEDILLRGVVRVENVANPAQYVPAVLGRTQSRHLERTYEIKPSEYNGNAIEFLSFLARKGGRLLKGGEPDVDGVAKMVLNDFLRGKIPWFSAPPGKGESKAGDQEKGTDVIDGREGRLGEMPAKATKRKRDETEGLSEGLRGDLDGGEVDNEEDEGMTDDPNDTEEHEEGGIDSENDAGLQLDKPEGHFESFSTDDEDEHEDPGGVSTDG